MKHLPASKKDEKLNKSVQRAKKKDDKNKQAFASSKLRDWVTCDSCNARRCIYSMKSVGNKGGPTKDDKRDLENWKEIGYVCGNKPGARNYVMKRTIRCGDQVETQFYQSELITGKQTVGRSISTDPICCLCYDDHDIVGASEIKRKQNVGGKNPLPVCRQCFDGALDSKIALPTTKGNSNHREKGAQDRVSKRRMYGKAVSRGYKRPRK